MNAPRTVGLRGERRDAGFTLVEVLVAVVIEALIVGALGTAFVGILNNSTSVKDSLTKSADARIAAHYIVSDARNSSGPEISLTDTTSCGSGTGAAAVVRFNWVSTSSFGSPTANIVDYVLIGNSLVRRECQGGVLVSTSTVARSVAGVLVTCAPTSCGGAPTSITATITETADANGTSFKYSLTGAFRKLIDTGPPVNPRSVFTLGSGDCVSVGGTGVSLTASSDLVVYGDLYVNTVNGSCKALSFTSNSTYRAGSTSILTGGTCASTTGAIACPAYTSYSPALIDPYLGLPPLTTSGLSNQTASTQCTAGNPTAQPGVYAGVLTISGVNCTLATGTYFLQEGVSISSSGSLTSAAGGVLLYIAGGSLHTASGGSIVASAKTTGSYKGVVVWEPAANTQDLSFTSSGTVALTGAIYSPAADVRFQTTAATPPKVSSIVSQTIWMGGGHLVIGAPSPSPLSFSAVSLPLAWTAGKAYPSTTLTPVGGDGFYTWSATGLPSTLAIDPVTGSVSGTPAAAGSSAVTISLNDRLGDDVAPYSFTLTINPTPLISTVSLPQGEKTAAYSASMAVAGGTAPFVWSQTGLPAGLTMSSAGAISGTPTGAAGTATVAVTLTDAAGVTASKSVSISVVVGPSVTTASLPNGIFGVAYSKTLTASLGTTPYTWSATGLPAGLTIAAGTGVISGTPTGGGTSTVVLAVSDAAGGSASVSLALTIQPSITGVTLKNGGATAGKLEKGDQVIVTYSAQMKVSTICSNWSTDTTDKLLNASNDVTVTVTNATNDVLTVTSAACGTLHFDSIDLKSPSYVTATAAFGGTTTNVSTIAWTASTHTLTITLGALKSGTVAATAVTSSIPVYTASGLIQDSPGVALGSTTFTLVSAKQF